MQAVPYGLGPDQVGDLYLPGQDRPPIVCLLHGGFWLAPYGRDQMDAIADDLVSNGYAVWNLEYRRLGAPGAGWVGTFEDVAAGIEHLAELPVSLDLARVVVVGHSAGGHLALWVAAKARLSPVRVLAVAALAPIADLARAYELGLGGDALARLLGGPPGQFPERYRVASPIEMLPLGARQLVLHGTADDLVPVELSRRYAAAAHDAGDDVELVELSGTGHMEFLDPGSEAHATLRRWLRAVVGT